MQPGTPAAGSHWIQDWPLASGSFFVFFLFFFFIFFRWGGGGGGGGAVGAGEGEFVSSYSSGNRSSWFLFVCFCSFFFFILKGERGRSSDVPPPQAQ